MSTDPSAKSSESVDIVALEPVVARRAERNGFWLAVAGFLIALAVALYAHTEIRSLRQESARRLTDLQDSATRARESAARAEADTRDAAAKLAVLEAKVGEEQSQRQALEQLYADLSRGRDDAVLVEVERLITMAAQEMQISGNLPTALAALQTADARLARTDSARFIPLRRVLTRDIEKLKTAPSVDFTGIAVKLDQAIAGVDSWPLLADAKLAPRPQVRTAPAPGSPWWAETRDFIRIWFDDLLRIREIDTPDAMLLSGAQQQLLRQQIKLRLLNARQALLGHNDRLFRADLGEAQRLMTSYVDLHQDVAATALAQLKSLGATTLSVDAPQLGDSLAAVRAMRSTPGR